jgi:hypothetical protein
MVLVFWRLRVMKKGTDVIRRLRDLIDKLLKLFERLFINFFVKIHEEVCKIGFGGD